MWTGIPHTDLPIIATCEKMGPTGMYGQTPQLISVTLTTRWEKNERDLFDILRCALLGRNVWTAKWLTWVMGTNSPSKLPCKTKFFVVPMRTDSPLPSATVRIGPNKSGTCDQAITNHVYSLFIWSVFSHIHLLLQMMILLMSKRRHHMFYLWSAKSNACKSAASCQRKQQSSFFFPSQYRRYSVFNILSQHSDDSFNLTMRCSTTKLGCILIKQNNKVPGIPKHCITRKFHCGTNLQLFAEKLILLFLKCTKMPQNGTKAMDTY